ncbi:MAG: hypothetical protein WDZ28_02155 [Simkaniaceae bacterium]
MRFNQIYLFLLAPLFLFSKEASHGKVPHHFQVEADWVYFRLSESGNLCLTKKDSTSSHESCVIDTDDIVNRFRYKSGLRLGISILPNLDHTFEARFTGFLKWDAGKGVSSDGDLYFPTNPNETVDYIDADNANVRYRSNLDTGELNYWRHVTPRRINYFSVSWVAGLRFIEIDEKVRVRFMKDLQKSNYRAKTWNHMFGLQFGGDFIGSPVKWFNWGLGGKVALLGNKGEQNSKMKDEGDTITLRNFKHDAFNLGWCGEFAPFIFLRPSERLLFQFRYEVFFVSNVASAPTQLGTKGYLGNVVKNNSDMLYHGGVAGIGFDF